MDKEWLKEVVTKEMQLLFNMRTPTYFDFEKTNKKVRSLIDQADEPTHERTGSNKSVIKSYYAGTNPND